MNTFSRVAVAMVGMTGLVAAQPKAEPKAGAIRAALLEGHEEFFRPARVKTAALIGDLDVHVIGDHARGQGNVTARMCELERVLEQVGER